MHGKKHNTPSCIQKNMNKINIDCVNVSIFTMPKIPYSKCHHKI